MTARPAFESLPLGAVRPSGWLRDQLLAQAAGITGRLEQLWPDVGPTSGWLGGPGECWERGPYYLNGLVPLAWVLDDDDLRARARPWIEWTLASQREDGFFGPAANLDWWPRTVMLTVLLSHHSATGDDRVPPFVERYLRHVLDRLPEQPLEMWAAARGAELLPTVLWCQQRTAEPWLVDLAALLLRQSTDWGAVYRDFTYTAPASTLPLGRLLRAYLPPRTLVEEVVRRWRPAKRTRRRTADQIERSNASATVRFYHRTHGVNHAMALRATAYAALVTGADPRAEASLADEVITRHHGSVVGVVTADEHLAGRSPVHGIETCSVVETMRSCEEVLRITGDGHWGDRLEEAAFNALPAALTANLLGHQYYQQVTQVEVSRRWRPWFNVSDDATLFGLEPTFGCCTANLHQGWPRLAASAVMRSSDDGLALTALVPCTATALVAGTDVRLEVETAYPFDGDVRVRVRVPKAETAAFPLRLRVPGWAVGATVDVDGTPEAALARDGFVTLDRAWRDRDLVTLRLPMRLRLEGAAAGGEAPTEPPRGVVVRRGPLVLSLALPERWHARPGKHGVPDHEVRSGAPWAFGLAAESLLDADVRTHDVPAVPFDHDRPALEVALTVRAVPAWRARHGSAGPVPDVRVDALGAPERARFVPYGCTALRVTVLPVLPSGHDV